MSRTRLAPPPRDPRRTGGLAPLRDRVVLGLHRLVERLDLTPPEIGDEPLTDAKAVRSEWRRYLRLWENYNPGEVFALKVSGFLAVATILAVSLVIVIML